MNNVTTELQLSNLRYIKTLGEIEAIREHELYQADNLNFLNNSTVQDKFLNKIDFCYIDPPYNTGNSEKTGFTYNDSFKKQGDISRHASWLKFMKSRLLVTAQLLKKTGVVAISIDDSAVHYLRVLCDEIFGEQNFVAQIVVDGGNMKNNTKLVSTSHDYLVVYAKNKNFLKVSGAKWRVSRDGLDVLRAKERSLRKIYKDDYNAITQELKIWMKTTKLSKRLKLFFNADSKGLYTYADLSAPGNGERYNVLHPVTQLPCQVPARGWGMTEDKLLKLIDDNLVIFGSDEKKQPMKKLYLKDNKDQVLRSVLSYPSRTSTHLLEHILGKRNTFNNPKNLNFISDIIDIMCPQDGIVLDFFAGSGTTGHAVLSLNHKSIESNRTFVLCTNDENGIYKDVCEPRLEAVITGVYGNGKKHVTLHDDKVTCFLID